MKTIRIDEVPVQANPHGIEARRLYGGSIAQVVHLTLRPGEGLKRHITPVDVLFFVLEGEGTVEVGDERRTVPAGTLVESPARIPHRWENTGSGVLKVLVTKIPAPTEPTQLL